ncbi:MAG: hypothetical protein A3B47_01970 [Candidatus Levybacteria bacterium RIFCSPLOWO2_01_FULL_39_24]|nr:MAG: hypothetical protein A2800_01265 [Candidatus Levybacteria bacterium RIFCSPHIGHO2_01_FULL_40_16]OGH46408.1 MAG: hypothetical protein A3B47_01970 [Candidatus Levybacteria bacterium RIFCSPLOWO2_01_FULL_39_24]
MKNNIFLIILIALYGVVMFSVISWGVPTGTRPFTYNMDEWHQLEAVRALFTRGTPNVPGAAHGSIFQFLVSGIYLIPFVFLGLVNPFTIHSSIDNPAMQERLFVILRSNTLLFGVLSIIVVAITAKKYLKTNPAFAAILMMGTPIWLTLSSYFKYDVALIFWIALSLFFLLRYAKKPTLRNFIYSAIPCALSLATKVSAVPMLIIYSFSFFWFTPHWRKNYKYLVLGIITFLGIFIILGVPDLIFRWSDYSEYLSSNLITAVQNDNNYLLGVSNKWIYILFTIFPMIFGHIFYVLFFITFIYWFIKIIKLFQVKKHVNYKSEIFLFFSLKIFLLSLVPLGLGATGNRSLVLLPFFALLSAKFIANILKLKKYKLYLVISISILILLQFHESSVVITAKYNKSALQRSSDWIVKNIHKDTVVGIENIPIYQTLPDIMLKEYYLSTSNKHVKTNYAYEIVNSLSEKLPEVVIITNRYMHEEFVIKSPKKDLLKRLKRENYKVVGEFMPNPQLYKLFYNDLDYYQSGLNFVFPVTIYEKG